MFILGEKIIIVGIPTDNDYWNIPDELISQTGHIIEIRRDRYLIQLENGDKWTVPFDPYVIQRFIKNKWNPLNYKSHFEPLKLP